MKSKGSELSCKSLAIYAFLVKYNKYEERDREEMEKSTNTIDNLIIFFAGNSQPYCPHYCMSAYNR